MNTFKNWQLFDELPHGWSFDKTAGSPLSGYSFATDGKSILRGGKRALVRVVDRQIPLFEHYPKWKQLQDNTEEPKTKQVIDENYCRTVNELARAKFKQRILNDILVDLTICEIEGWCKTEYINELQRLVMSLYEKECIDIT